MSRSGQRRAYGTSLAWLFTVGIVGCLALTGCVNGGSGPHEKATSPSVGPDTASSAPSSGSPALESRTLPDSDETLIRVDVLSLARLGNDKLKLRLRIADPDKYDVQLAGLFGSDTYDDVVIIDSRHMMAYYPLQSTQNNVLESGYPEDNSVDTGHAIYSSIFFPAPPAGTVKADIAFPSVPMFTDIPIRGTAQVAQGEPDPNRVALKPPRIESLTGISEDLNGDQGIDQSGNGESIRLSSDVLFALNKAKLSSRAKSVLKGVAARIDQAKTPVIKVDGYTDNSGNDAINDPLSRRRAQAVAGELKKLVTRTGVTYRTAGHGSADPVATNDSAAGRQKNRRVTVTIGK